MFPFFFVPSAMVTTAGFSGYKTSYISGVNDGSIGGYPSLRFNPLGNGFIGATLLGAVADPSLALALVVGHLHFKMEWSCLPWEQVQRAMYLCILAVWLYCKVWSIGTSS